MFVQLISKKHVLKLRKKLDIYCFLIKNRYNQNRKIKMMEESNE